MEAFALDQMLQQAPAVGAVVLVVVVFLRHLTASDQGNREVMRELRDAIRALTKELNDDRNQVNHERRNP